jgi:(2Fe-2S) ferredoxin
MVMQCVSKANQISRAHIMKLTGFSRTHVSEVVDKLIAEGELIETELINTGRGRPTALLEVNPDQFCAAGVWLAEDSIEVDVAGATGKSIIRDSLS